ncbi:hypothetical protein HAT86_12040 [Roseovarius gahaiensis]|uniref:Uncharacterized protein n=1 Tax=Roseovarius gahaiensis TaxID=2716691 RepID=A0A967BFM4_9RHOB|nr:hypothetical protein [Roseovarius gahaiensis]NHQ75186.1 hypothetical protein [Roseovarius gahaiensis]
MNWEKDVIRRTMEAVGEDTGAALDMLLRRLDGVPGATDAIADVVQAMAERHAAHAGELRAEIRRRNGGAEIIELEK